MSHFFFERLLWFFIKTGRPEILHDLRKCGALMCSERKRTRRAGQHDLKSISALTEHVISIMMNKWAFYIKFFTPKFFVPPVQNVPNSVAVDFKGRLMQERPRGFSDWFYAQPVVFTGGFFCFHWFPGGEMRGEWDGWLGWCRWACRSSRLGINSPSHKMQQPKEDFLCCGKVQHAAMPEEALKLSDKS